MIERRVVRAIERETFESNRVQTRSTTTAIFDVGYGTVKTSVRLMALFARRVAFRQTIVAAPLPLLIEHRLRAGQWDLVHFLSRL